MSERLKSCPFCGGNAKLNEGVYEGDKIFSVSCCECHTSTGSSIHPENVIEIWDTRENIYTCPFCGGKAELVEAEEDGVKYFLVVCENCGMGSVGTPNAHEAIAAWNKRINL